MKYMRKTPVEAIQWNGDNLNEVYDFIIKTAKSCCAKDDYSDLIIAYEDRSIVRMGCERGQDLSVLQGCHIQKDL